MTPMHDDTIARWLDVIRAESRESPGWHRTKRQVQRFWGLDAMTCDRLLASLIDGRFLTLARTGGYVRAAA